MHILILLTICIMMSIMLTSLYEKTWKFTAACLNSHQLSLDTLF